MNQTSSRSRLKLLALLIFGASLYFFLIGRFAGYFAEADTFQQSQHILAAEHSGSFVDSLLPYSNGYGFTAISLFLMSFTGLSVQTIQVYLYPLITLSIIPIAFVCYRAFLRNEALALIATFLLYLQGDFLFVTWRGSHERFTWLYAILIVFLLVKSLNQREFSKVAKHILFLYAIVFGLTTINSFFASSFLLSVTLCFMGSGLYYLIRSRRSNQAETSKTIKSNTQRLLYVTVSTFLFIYLFIFYFYPVAGRSVEVLQTLLEKILLVFGGFEQRFNPYSGLVDAIWPNRFVYFYVSSFNWIIIFISLIGWLWELPRLLGFEENQDYDPNRQFLWLFYAASAFQVGLGIFADQTQFLSGNLQVRLFTPFVLFALPVLAYSFARFTKLIQNKRLLFFGRIGLSIMVVVLTIATMLKAALEPVIASKWLFVNSEEIAAGEWIMTYGKVDDRIWAGIDERLITGIYFHSSLSNESVTTVENLILFQRNTQDVPYLLVTDAEVRRAVLNAYVLPELANENLIYANNSANFYRRRARSAFQR